jgi:TPP-dependent pyruvate/acetoin dehydrogenase alpha subunit
MWDIEALERMTLIRSFEQAAGELLASGEIPGFLHLSIGQEAVAVGVNTALRATDHITTTHRGHGHCIAKGGSIERMVSELFGREDGYCRGRSGSMHIAAPEVGILGANAIVGGGISPALGSALASQVRRRDAVSVSFFGEGAVGQGVFHEAMNLAALWRLPMIFVCENNQYAELSHVAAHLSAPSVAAFADVYGVPSKTVDGNDVRLVYQATTEAVERARSGEGPSLLEFMTYRIRGHFEGDAQKYRPRDEVAAWKKRDPIRLHADRLVTEGLCGPDYPHEVAQACEQQIQAAVEKAQASAQSNREPRARLVQQVYADSSPAGVR